MKEFVHVQVKILFSLHNVRENIHDIYPIHQAVIHNKPIYLTIQHAKSSIPAKYVKRFSISSLAIIPIIVNDLAIGLVLVDPHSRQRARYQE
ncbi:hypothetical protein RCO48_31730 [Peribacillus frigoritolerans]|nr:hypothetical protein [Peribacillus frigoritolerans]